MKLICSIVNSFCFKVAQNFRDTFQWGNFNIFNRLPNRVKNWTLIALFSSGSFHSNTLAHGSWIGPGNSCYPGEIIVELSCQWVSGENLYLFQLFRFPIVYLGKRWKSIKYGLFRGETGHWNYQRRSHPPPVASLEHCHPQWFGSRTKSCRPWNFYGIPLKVPN